MARSLRFSALASLAVLLQCGRDTEVIPPDPPYVPPPETCDANDVSAPRTFASCTTGGGIFGQWIVDEHGLPAYQYGLDENADARAAWPNTEKKDRRDHWSSFGNGHVTALAYNDGYVEVTMQDRGLEYLNKYDEDQGHFAGGFSYIDDGGTVWSSAYKWRPQGSVVTRVFGVGYAKTTIRYHGLALTRVQYAASGDVPVVADEILLENETDQRKELSHYEYWDVARRPIETNWIVSGDPLTAVPQSVRDKRDARNADFQEEAQWDPATRIIAARRTYTGAAPAPPKDAPSATNDYPADPFLAVLIANPDAVYTDRKTFFGGGGVAAPDAVTRHLGGDFGAGSKSSAAGQPHLFAVRTDLVLPPHGSQGLRFAYGFAPMGEPFTIQDEWHDPRCNMQDEARRERSGHLMYFATDRDPVLHREMLWHSAKIEDSVTKRDYWGAHVVPQGSAYLYLHGADGALRDLALFAVPLVYTHHALAGEQLTAMMGMQRASDHAFSYAFQGHGMLDDALGIHAKPSDQDLFFLLALVEYAGATGDPGFLDQLVPYWPKEARPDAVVLDHVKDSVRHFFDDVGTGPHGLVRMGDGDWSDGIAFEAPDRQLALAQGESVPNTQMAVAVLPRVADLLDAREPALAAEIRTKVDAFRAALAGTWTGSFFGRAYFGDDKLAYADTINLESQVWALIGGSFQAPEQRATLVGAIATKLDDPSPIGATLVPGGQVWPAISGLLSWGYAASDPERAWSHLARNTLSAHAVAWPALWYGIWSGPDGLQTTGDRAGQTWFSAATPMVDFPVLNNNAHAMPLFALLRVVGVEADAAGLVLTPHLVGRSFSMQTELLDLSQRGTTLTGAYRIPFNVARTITVHAPPGYTIASAKLDGQDVPVTASLATLAVAAHDGAPANFEIQLAK